MIQKILFLISLITLNNTEDAVGCSADVVEPPCTVPLQNVPLKSWQEWTLREKRSMLEDQSEEHGGRTVLYRACRILIAADSTLPGSAATWPADEVRQTLKHKNKRSLLELVFLPPGSFSADPLLNQTQLFSPKARCLEATWSDLNFCHNTAPRNWAPSLGINGHKGVHAWI